MDVNELKDKVQGIISELEANGEITDPIKALVYTKALDLLRCVDLLELNHPSSPF